VLESTLFVAHEHEDNPNTMAPHSATVILVISLAACEQTADFRKAFTLKELSAVLLRGGCPGRLIPA
jgi:hypothetical protein